MMTERERELRRQLTTAIERLERAIELLEKSHRKCIAIGVLPEYSDDELEAFDALTARYARASDRLTHRVFPLFDIIELEPRGSFLDTINRAEKRGIIPSALLFKEIREVRNEIAHEYSLRDPAVLFADVLRLSPLVIEAVNSVRSYMPET